jgi:hypothetical protein
VDSTDLHCGSLRDKIAIETKNTKTISISITITITINNPPFKESASYLIQFNSIQFYTIKKNQTVFLISL